MKFFAKSPRFYRNRGPETGAPETGSGQHIREREINDLQRRSHMQPAHMLILR